VENWWDKVTGKTETYTENPVTMPLYPSHSHMHWPMT